MGEVVIPPDSSGAASTPNARSTDSSPRIAAVVILYNPASETLADLLKSILDQVATIIAVDNTPGSRLSSNPIPAPYADTVIYQPIGDNVGIAAAQNIGIKRALESRHTHVLLLDQDSLLPPAMVQDLLANERLLKTSGISVAAVGPVFVDVKTGDASFAVKHSFLHVRKIYASDRDKTPIESDSLIASGSLISAETLAEVGWMCEPLFIDRVDIEWGLRARAKGYLSYVCPSVVMRHSLGETSVRYGKKAINFHSDLRHYYMIRNSVYLLRKSYMGWRWKSFSLSRVPMYLVFYSMHSKRPIASFFLLLRAIRDGVRGKLGRIDTM